MNPANERLAMHYIRKELRSQQQERRELARQEEERKEKKAKEEMDYFIDYTMRMHGSMLCDRSYIKHITGPSRVWVPQSFTEFLQEESRKKREAELKRREEEEASVGINDIGRIIFKDEVEYLHVPRIIASEK